jgi:hypothetical protein
MNATEIVALVLGSTSAMGILTVIVTTWLKRGDMKMDEATAIRAELRAQNDRLTTRCDKLEADLDEWRTKYFTLSQRNIDLQAQVDILEAGKVAMQQEIDKLRAEVADLRTGTGEMRNVRAEHARLGKVTADEVQTKRLTAAQAEIDLLKKKQA